MMLRVRKSCHAACYWLTTAIWQAGCTRPFHNKDGWNWTTLSYAAILFSSAALLAHAYNCPNGLHLNLEANTKKAKQRVVVETDLQTRLQMSAYRARTWLITGASVSRRMCRTVQVGHTIPLRTASIRVE
jgi:hypothetical protein